MSAGRKIDDKFHVDSGEVVKTTSGEMVPHDEPLFLLRARDYLALPAMEHLRELCRLDGCNDWQLAGIDAEIARFREFAEQHPERMKQPGITRGAPWKGERPARQDAATATGESS